MNQLPFWICTFFSAILYFVAPISYDRLFCVMCLLVFLVPAGMMMYDDSKRIGIINFNNLFLFSFFACTYVYPVFLVNKESLIGELISEQILTFNTLNRCCALCSLAVNVYGLSYSLFRKRGKRNLNISFERNKASILYNNVRILTLVLCALFLYILIDFLRNYNGQDIEINESYFFQVFYNVLPMFLVAAAIYYHPTNFKTNSNSLKSFFKKNKWELSLLLLGLVLLVVIGDRAPIMSVALTIVAAITLYVKKIKTRHLILFGVIGIVLMFALRVTRASSYSILDGGFSTALEHTSTTMGAAGSAWDVLSDLVGMNVELNVGMDYHDKYGAYYPGANLIRIITAPVPFLPSYLIQKYYNKTLSETTSHDAINDYINENGGTHCVIDIFLPFGVIGVIFVYLILGWFIAKMTNGVSKKLFCQIFYVFLVSSAIFMARNAVTNIYRSFVISYVIYYILLHINSRRRFKRVSVYKKEEYNYND